MIVNNKMIQTNVFRFQTSNACAGNCQPGETCNELYIKCQVQGKINIKETCAFFFKISVNGTI